MCGVCVMCVCPVFFKDIFMRQPYHFPLIIPFSEFAAEQQRPAESFCCRDGGHSFINNYTMFRVFRHV